MVFSIRVVPVFMLQWPIFFNSTIYTIVLYITISLYAQCTLYTIHYTVYSILYYAICIIQQLIQI